ncbi:MAG: hypothetical protein ACOY3E_06120 [Pseudomonadota bacterium]
MMWLMYRPAAASANEASDKTPDLGKSKDHEPVRFNERELALLADLLQARLAVPHKQPDPQSTTVIEERAA